MNKAQFTEAIALETGLTKLEVRKLLNASIRVASGVFLEGGDLTLSGFGAFSLVHRPAIRSAIPALEVPPHSCTEDRAVSPHGGAE